MIKPYYKSSDHAFNLIHGDTFELLPQFNFKFDMIFADPPYFLSSGGISVQSGKIVCVDKGDWDKSMSQEEINAFNLKWLSLCRDKLKDNGTIWISGTYHNIFSVANCLTELGYKILNVVTWAKTNPPPNISCRYFTYSTEFVIWARKMEKVPHYYNYELMKRINEDKQMTDVWRLPAISPWEKSCTKHPTQKPLGLLCRIIMASTRPGSWILDPFAGSSTTGIAANLLGRKFLGIEKEEEYAMISIARREEIEDPKIAANYKRKVPDIVKAEDTQTDCFVGCTDPVVELLPFLEDDWENMKNDILMFAANKVTRNSMESVGKLAIGVKDNAINDINITGIGYIMFHYWKNEEATPYQITNVPRIVDKKDVPDGYLLRMNNNAQKFLLLEYNSSKPADIGAYNIMSLQGDRKRKDRYKSFIVPLNRILLDT